MQITDRDVYLERLSKPLLEKLKISKFIPENARYILDVGCANGVVTRALAYIFPHISFLGIDIDEDFINRAKADPQNPTNLSFECTCLRDLLKRTQKYDSVVFCSVLHEFFTYGEGISSVLKALADAHELLNIGGDIIIRDMILREYTKEADLSVKRVVGKLFAKEFISKQVEDYEKFYGKLDNHFDINHLLLKYFYVENWGRELRENYVCVTFENYEKIFNLLGMKVQFEDSYLIEYLRSKWKEDFGFTGDELAFYKSTGFVVARK